MRPTLEERFWEKVDMSGDCWLWTGAKSTDGYGWFRVYPSTIYAHRQSYLLAVGPIPEGLTIDHLCRVRLCVNPTHLEPVTRETNFRRGYWGTRTTCVNGHSLADSRPYFYAVNGKTSRPCRTCQARNSRAYMARKRDRQAVA